MLIRNHRKSSVVFIHLLLIFLITSCGGGGSGLPPGFGNPIDDPSFPYRGTITLDEYKSFSVSDPNLGVVDITLSPLSKRKLFDGSMPRRHSSGALSFRQSCGQRSHRIMLLEVDESIARQITPCSNTIEISRFSTTDFAVSSLSPNAEQIVVEANYIRNTNTRVAVLVFDVASRDLISIWDNFGAPMWLRDGRLLLSTSNGFYITTVDQETPVRFPDGLTNAVNNPALHPTKDIIAFEYNHQIWTMKIDGTDVQEEIYGASRLLFPTWSPDGDTLLYLQIPRANKIERALSFTNLVTQTSYGLSLDPVLGILDTITVNGPLSWY